MYRTVVLTTAMFTTLLASAAAFAQNDSGHTSTSSNGAYDGDGWFARPSAGPSSSFIPFTSYGYAGVSVGQSRYDLNCVSQFSCEQHTTGFKIFTGGQLFRVVGLDLAYLNMGSVYRNGGSSRAQGIGLNAVGNLPIWHFNAFVKVGTTYGWTRTGSATPLASSGSNRGFGLSYGAGVQYDFRERWAHGWSETAFAFISPTGATTSTL